MLDPATTATHQDVAAATAALTLDDITVIEIDREATPYAIAELADPYGRRHEVVTVYYALRDPVASRQFEISASEDHIPDGGSALREMLDRWAASTSASDLVTLREQSLDLARQAERLQLRMPPSAINEVMDPEDVDCLAAVTRMIPDNAQPTLVFQGADFEHGTRKMLSPGETGVCLTGGTIELRLNYLDDGTEDTDDFAVTKFDIRDVVDLVLLTLSGRHDAELAVDWEETELRRDLPRVSHYDEPTESADPVFACMDTPSWERRIAVKVAAHSDALAAAEKARKDRDGMLVAAAVFGHPKAAIARVAGLSRQQVYEIIGRRDGQ